MSALLRFIETPGVKCITSCLPFLLERATVRRTCSPRGVNPDEGYFWSKPGYTVAGSRQACVRHMQMWDTDHVAGSVWRDTISTFPGPDRQCDERPRLFRGHQLSRSLRLQIRKGTFSLLSAVRAAWSRHDHSSAAKAEKGAIASDQHDRPISSSTRSQSTVFFDRGRGGQSCAYEAPCLCSLAHGDVDMPDVHFDFIDSRAVDDEQRPTAAEVDAAAFTTAKVIAWLAKLKGSLKVAGHKRDRKVADLKQKLKKLCHCMLAADVRCSALCFQERSVL